jgi:aspartyl-tRNA(Asn)/glutamyl-tRNA(Gln) amidotransferase subunit B
MIQPREAISVTLTATKYETVIGLEVHSQLLTRSKMFCACPIPPSDAAPNTFVCPICLGMPGVLPVINAKAVEFTVMTGLALNCAIPEYSKFDRKNYNYPDLMKGYQISQYDLPIAREGWLEVDVEGTVKRIGLTRVHLEEDTARLQHYESGPTGYSLVDVNRSSVPLMEIVSEPDMRSAEEARAYLIKLRQILRYLGTSNANMEEGNFRCDANISLRPAGSREFGSKVEVKNMNSFRAVFRALEFEAQRQARVLDEGGRIPQETRGWVESEGKTVSQRSKEFAHDYRYFPEPDLPPLIFSRSWIDSVRAALPELPDAKRLRFEEEYGLGQYEANLLTETRERANYFEAVVAGATASEVQRRAKLAANWMLGDLARLQHAAGVEIDETPISAEHLAHLLQLVEAGRVTGTAAKQVLERMFERGEDAETVVRELGLETISEGAHLSEAAARVLAANPKAVADYCAGKTEALQFLVGQFMREMRGRADAARARELLAAQIRCE